MITITDLDLIIDDPKIETNVTLREIYINAILFISTKLPPISPDQYLKRMKVFLELENKNNESVIIENGIKEVLVNNICLMGCTIYSGATAIKHLNVCESVSVSNKE